MWIARPTSQTTYPLHDACNSLANCACHIIVQRVQVVTADKHRTPSTKAQELIDYPRYFNDEYCIRAKAYIPHQALLVTFIRCKRVVEI